MTALKNKVFLTVVFLGLMIAELDAYAFTLNDNRTFFGILCTR